MPNETHYVMNGGGSFQRVSTTSLCVHGEITNYNTIFIKTLFICYTELNVLLLCLDEFM